MSYTIKSCFDPAQVLKLDIAKDDDGKFLLLKSWDDDIADGITIALNEYQIKKLKVFIREILKDGKNNRPDFD